MPEAPIPPQPPKATAKGKGGAKPVPPKPLEGTTTIDDNMVFEVEALSHVAVSHLAAKIAKSIKDNTNASADLPVRVIFLGEGLPQALEFSRTFSVQLKLLQDAFDSALKLAQEGLAPLSAPLQPAAVAGGTTAASGFGLTAAVGGALNLLALFRQNTSYFGRKVEITEPAIVVELARCLRQHKGISFYWPGLGLSHDSVLATSSAPPFLEDVQRAMGRRDQATAGIHNLAVAIGKLDKEAAELPAARFALDRAHELFDSADSVLRRLTTSLSKADAETGVTPLQLLQRAHDVRNQIITADGKVYFLYVRLEAAGGSYRIRRNLFRTLFWKDGLSFSGGAVVSYALLETNGEFVSSANLRQRKAFVSFEEILTDFGGW